MIFDERLLKPARPRMWVRVGVALMVSIILHVLVYGWLFLQPLLLSVTDIQIVDRPYEPFPGRLLGRLVAPPSVSPKMKAPRRISTRVEEEKSALSESSDARDAKEATQRVTAQPISSDAFAAINLAPLRDGVVDIVDELKKAGLLEKPADFSVWAGFRFLDDGRLSDMEIIRSSGNGVIDHQVLVALWAMSESRVAAPISSLKHGQIRLRVGPKSTELEIRGVAHSSQDAKVLGESLKVLLFSTVLVMNSNPDWRDILNAMRIDIEDNVIVFRAMAEADVIDRVIQKNIHHFQK